jgi:hypothetical protein
LPPSLCTPSPPCHPSMNLADYWKCCTNWKGVHPRCSSCSPYQNELDTCVSTSNSVLIASWSHSDNHVFMKFRTRSSGWKLSPSNA